MSKRDIVDELRDHQKEAMSWQGDLFARAARDIEELREQLREAHSELDKLLGELKTLEREP